MSTKQVETATVVGSISGDGNVSVIVTAARMPNSPVTVLVDVTTADTTAALVASHIRPALALNEDIGGFFVVTGTGANIILTCRVAAPNDTTLNIAIANGTCTGLTAAPTSANTLAGDGIANGYATLAEYKQWIAVRGLNGQPGTDANDDAVLELLIEAASRHFDLKTGRRFYMPAADETRYYTPDDPECVRIDDFGSVTSVSVDYSGIRSYTALTLSTDFDLLPDNAALYGYPYNQVALIMTSGAYLPTTRRALQVVGKPGWPAVPKDVKEAVLAIVQNVSASRSGQTSSGKVTITSAGVVIRPEEVPAFAQDIIEKYQSKV